MAKAKKIQPEKVVKTEVKKDKATHTVKVPFRDANNFDIKYEEGDDVSHFDEQRLQKLVDAGHVKSSLNQ